jgi:hypothetical protein
LTGEYANSVVDVHGSAVGRIAALGAGEEGDSLVVKKGVVGVREGAKATTHFVNNDNNRTICKGIFILKRLVF